jgi:hypothetical protein
LSKLKDLNQKSFEWDLGTEESEVLDQAAKKLWGQQCRWSSRPESWDSREQ